MPPLHLQADPGRARANSAPSPSIQQRADAFIEVLRAALTYRRQDAIELLVDAIGDDVAQAIAEAVRVRPAKSSRHEPSGPRPSTPPLDVTFSPDLQAEWDSLIDGYPRLTGLAWAKVKFVKLEWERPGFREEFRDGVAAAKRSQDFADGFAPALERFLDERRWEDRPRSTLAARQAQRREAELRERAAIRSPVHCDEPFPATELFRLKVAADSGDELARARYESALRANAEAHKAAVEKARFSRSLDAALSSVKQSA